MRRILSCSAQPAFFCWLIGWIMLVACPAFAAAAYIRVNQIGYEAGLTARAYLMTASSAAETAFAVKNSSGQIVALGSVGTKLGEWGSYNVYPIDFTLSAADTYTIGVSGARRSGIGAVSRGYSGESLCDTAGEQPLFL